jgi:hypothetical protein
LRELIELAELLVQGHEEGTVGIQFIQSLADEFQKWEAQHRAEILVDNSVGPKAMEEVADVRIVLARIHTFFLGVLADEQAQDAKMEINVKRKWKLDGHGHGQHV